MEFPTLVYKDGGPHQRPGGTFNYRRIVNESELAAALADGWHPTLVEATQFSSPDDDAPPTRDELEAKARELGIKFDGRTGDKTLAAKIEAALAGA